MTINKAYLSIADVVYSGDNLGDDIRLSVSLAGKTIRSNHQIAHGSTRRLAKKLTSVESAESSLSLPVSIRIREEDPVFDDQGGTAGTWRIDMTRTGVQTRVFDVEVHGDSIGDRGDVGRFRVTLAADVQVAGVRYVGDVADGWLLTNIDGIGRWSLPYGLKLMFLERRQVRGVQRDFFEVLEGRHQGRKGNVRAKADGSSYLVEGLRQQGPVRLRFSIGKEEVELVGGGLRLPAKTDARNPTPLGVHDLEIPYEAHKGGNYYRSRYGITHAKTWFRVGHGGDRFLHPGRRSAGCVTVITDDQHKGWERLYAALILSRQDARSVGTIEVLP